VTISEDGLKDLAAQDCPTPWIVLLTLSHPTLSTPMCFSSDSIDTLSNGVMYHAFPFEIVLPDDADGRTPQATLRVDNASQEVVAVIRAMTSPPQLDIRVVRAAAPDLVERQWLGFEWRASTYDVSYITGTLTIDDMAQEEFPYITFDGRFKALWP